MEEREAMTKRIDDLRDAHEIDQALAESIELGNVRIVGQNRGGEDLLELTSKGITRTVILVLNALIEQADREKRDFTAEEKFEALSHIVNAVKKLQEGQEGE